jgi:hypothetical protein
MQCLTTFIVYSSNLWKNYIFRYHKCHRCTAACYLCQNWNVEVCIWRNQQHVATHPNKGMKTCPILESPRMYRGRIALCISSSHPPQLASGKHMIFGQWVGWVQVRLQFLAVICTSSVWGCKTIIFPFSFHITIYIHFSEQYASRANDIECSQLFWHITDRSERRPNTYKLFGHIDTPSYSSFLIASHSYLSPT